MIDHIWDDDLLPRRIVTKRMTRARARTTTATKKLLWTVKSTYWDLLRNWHGAVLATQYTPALRLIVFGTITISNRALGISVDTQTFSIYFPLNWIELVWSIIMQMFNYRIRSIIAENK